MIQTIPIVIAFPFIVWGAITLIHKTINVEQRKEVQKWSKKLLKNF